MDIAQLNSSVHLQLGQPDVSLISPMEIHFAVKNAVTLHTRQLRNADQNSPISLSAEFTPTVSPYDITALVAKGEIAWMERQDGTVHWRPLRAINLAFLEDMYRDGVESFAVYTDEANLMWAKFSEPKGAESTTTYRIWFDKDIVLTGHGDDALFPESLVQVPILTASIELVQKINLRLASAIEDEESRKLMQVKIGAYNDLAARCELSLNRDWLPLFRRHKNRSRTAQNQTKLRPFMTNTHPARSGYFSLTGAPILTSSRSQKPLSSSTR